MTRARTPRSGVVLVALLAALAAAGCSSSKTTGPPFAISPTTATLVVGGSTQLTAVNPPGKVTWTSSNSGVASVVPETGYVTGVSIGSATISALSGGKLATAQITVNPPPPT